MGTRNDNMGAILAKAKASGFFPDIPDNELEVWETAGRDLFKDDSAIGSRAQTYLGADKCLYQPSPTSLIRWRAKRQATLAGGPQSHLGFLGDSIPFGAAATGASNPKYLNSYPGQIRTTLDKQYGSAGSGMVTSNPAVRANPAWDPRYTFAGSLLDHSFGLYSSSAYRLNGGSDAALDFTAVADEFWVYTVAGAGGTFTMQVDSGTVYSGTLGVDSAGTIQREAGYYNKAGGNWHSVFKLTTGSTASHTLKIRPVASVGQNAFITFVEARVNGNGRFRVSNVAQSSKSLLNVVTTASDPNGPDTLGLTGLTYIDDLKADLLVLALGINDWQGSQALANTKLRLNAIINRQRATTPPSTGVVPAGGDVVLLWNPQPDLSTLGGSIPWKAYRDLYYEVAEENDVALIDLGSRWKDFATANSFGMYADTIHPSDKGAGDIAGSVYRALFVEA